MKKLLLALPVAIFLFNACSTDIDLIADWKEIPVVYGLLNSNDTAHYIRITKAYLDPEKDARTIAQIPDSLYFDTLNVYLEEVGTENVFVLQKVDGNKEGYVKEPGIFAQQPNYLYKTKVKLKEGSRYKLTVVNPQTWKNASAEAVITAAVNLRDPWCDKGMWSESTDPRSTKVEWQAQNAQEIFEGTLRFNFREINSATGTDTVKFVEWQIFSDVTQPSCSGYFCASIPLRSLLTNVAARVQPQEGVSRIPRCVELSFWSGGEALKDYIVINQVQSSSIVQTQAVPEFTNIEGGIGLFSSRKDTTYTKFKIADDALDSLTTSELTKNLNFSVNQVCQCN